MEFAKSIVPKEDKAERETTVYGTVLRTSNKTAIVQLDGSSSETPATMTTDARAGDRVTVMIKSHKAMVTGNMTAPATARADDRYMRFTSDGLMVGRFDTSGNPSGYYVLIQDDAYLIKNASGTTVAKYGGNKITMYDANGNELGSFALNDQNGILYLVGDEGVGLKADSKDGSTGNLYEVQVAAKANESVRGPQVGFQVLTNGTVSSSVIVERGNVYVNTPGELILNSHPVITDDSIVKYGEHYVYGSVGANGIADVYQAIPNIPSGYQLGLLKSVSVFEEFANRDHQSRTRRTYLTAIETGVNPATGYARAWVANTSDQLRYYIVRFQWTAFKIGTVGQLAPTEIDIG